MKWTTAKQAWDAMDTVEGREAVKVILNGPDLTKKTGKVASQLITLFFEEDLVGRLYCGPPTG